VLFVGEHYFRARVVFVSSNGGAVRSISMSRAPETRIETEPRRDIDRMTMSRMTKEQKSRLYTRLTGSDPAVLLLFLFGFVLLIGLSVSLCYPAPRSHPLSLPQVKHSVTVHTRSELAFHLSKFL